MKNFKFVAKDQQGNIVREGTMQAYTKDNVRFHVCRRYSEGHLMFVDVEEIN